MNRRLYRSTDTVIGGVAAGVAEYLDADPSIVRIVWAILGFVTAGFFVLLYIVMWIVVPEAPRRLPGPPADAGLETAATTPAAAPATIPGGAPPAERAPRRGGSGSGAMILGLILIGLGIWFLLREYVPELDPGRWWPVSLVVLGVLLLIISLRRPSAE